MHGFPDVRSSLAAVKGTSGQPHSRVAVPIRPLRDLAAGLLFALLLVAAPSSAHKLRVFAAAEGARIQGSTYFAGGGKAAGARVRITDASDRVLAELEAGADGTFSYRARAPVVHRILAETQDGHRAEWQVGAAELAGAFPSQGRSQEGTDSAAPAAAKVDAAVQPAAGTDLRDTAQAAHACPPSAESALDPGVEAAIERAVARQVRPLREQLLATRDAVAFRDVLGGIGYILGLGGVGLWWYGRRRPDRR